MRIALPVPTRVPEQPLDPSRPSVNHDRSGLWAPEKSDPLGEFCSERVVPIGSAPALPEPGKAVSTRPAARRVVTPRATLVPVAPTPRASASKDRRGLWSFASGSAYGAIVCVIAVSWLTRSELSQSEASTGGSAPVSHAPV